MQTTKEWAKPDGESHSQRDQRGSKLKRRKRRRQAKTAAAYESDDLNPQLTSASKMLPSTLRGKEAALSERGDVLAKYETELMVKIAGDKHKQEQQKKKKQKQKQLLLRTEKEIAEAKKANFRYEARLARRGNVETPVNDLLAAQLRQVKAKRAQGAVRARTGATVKLPEGRGTS